MAASLLLVVICASFLITAETLSCTVYNIHECNSFILPHSPTTLVPYFTEQRLTAFCAAVPAYRKCVDQLRSSCESPGRLGIQGVEDLTTYVCSTEGRKLTLQTTPCIVEHSQQLELAGRACNTSYTNAVMRNPSELCGLTKDFINGCMKRAVQRHCGSETSGYLQTIMIMPLQPLFREAFNCNLKNGNSASSVTLSAMALIVPMATTMLAFMNTQGN